jgi:hypothetical protein
VKEVKMEKEDREKNSEKYLFFMNV